ALPFGSMIGSNKKFSLVTEVRKLDEYSSQLLIPRLSAAHQGNYTCVATNAARRATYTAPLTVSVPPRWVTEPEDVSVSRGQDVVIPCLTEGYPTPKITWRRANGVTTGNYHDLLPSIGIQQLANGSLFLSQVNKEVQGRYLCEASNGIGAGLSKVVQVNVHAPPLFNDDRENKSVGTGGQAILNCPVSGDQPMELKWLKNGRPLSSVDEYRFTQREDSVGIGGRRVNVGGPDDQRVFQLVISTVGTTDGGEYSCTISNAYGHATRIITLLVQEPPSIPRSLHVVEKTSRSVHLAWESPEDGNSPITKYTLKYSKVGGLWKQHDVKERVAGRGSLMEEKETTVTGDQREFLVEALTPAVDYLFNLYAHNALGTSKPSEVLQVTTEGEAPGGQPQRVEAISASSSSLTVRWSPPELNMQHGLIIAYRVGHRQAGFLSENYIFKQIEVSSAASSAGSSSQHTSDFACCSATIADLLPYTAYQVVVKALNKHGVGPPSLDVAATTKEDIPIGSPPGLRCSPMTATSILVSWETLSPTMARGKLLGYRVQSTMSDNVTEMNRDTTSSLSVALRNLKPFTNYSIQVAAFTQVGDGPYSQPITCITEEDVPGVLSGLKAHMASNNAVIVSWKPPDRPNGRLLTYTLNVKPSSSYSKKYVVRAPSTKHKIIVDRNDGSLQVRVSASTSIGEGPTSAPISISPSDRINAGIVSWGGPMSVHWKTDITLHCEAVGVPSPTRIWLRNGVPISHITNKRLSSYPDGNLVLRDIQKTDSTNYSCKVTNGHGHDSITYKLIVQVPPAPPVVHVTRADATSLTVSWRTADTGGSPLLGLIISYKRKYGEWREETVSPTITSHQLQGLSCGNQYHLYVKAFNKVGEGQASESIHASTAGGVPRAGQVAGVVAPNTTWATVSLAHWDDGGCPVTHYSVSYERKGSAAWVVVSERVDTVRPLVLGGLAPSSDYVVRVTAHNSAGTTVQDYPFTTTSLPGVSSPGMMSPSLNLVDIRVLLPIIASSLALLAAIVTVCVCARKRPPVIPPSEESIKKARESKEILQQGEQFYGTLRKNPSHRDSSILERIPEYADDIYPYATFQMNNEQHQRRNRHQLPPPYDHYQKISHKGSQNRGDPVSGESYCRVGVRGRHPTPGPRSLKSESEEYDTYGSDSETYGPVSSRTESSNHLDHDRSEPLRAVHHNIIYNTTESSSSTEASPTLPTRSFSRKRTRASITRNIVGALHTLLSPPRTPSSLLETPPPTIIPTYAPPTPFSDAHELSETECDRHVQSLMKKQRQRGTTINV
ncbi:unnamed protein product, partial [Meganyctiphanes norvegica]